jgi:hypothetical protein
MQNPILIATINNLGPLIQLSIAFYISLLWLAQSSEFQKGK